MALERKAGFQSGIATDAADTAAGYLTPDRYNLAHTVAGATSGGIPYFDSTTSEASSALLASGGVVIGGGAGAAPFTDAGLTYNSTTDALTVGGQLNVTGIIAPASTNGTASAPRIQLGNTNCGFWWPSGAPSLAWGGVEIWTADIAFRLASGKPLGWSSSTTPSSTLHDAGIARAATNSLVFAGASTVAGAITSRTEINKAVASIADNTATATFTVTVPNAAHSAMLKVTLVGSLGAGGAVGANEATGTISYDFAIARTAGVDTVVTASTAYGSSTSSVAGAATITVSAAASAMTGASSATQTFTVNVTIARGSGSSANHTCLCYGRLLNANATGVTIA